MKAITATDRAIDKAIVDAIKTFLATYNQTKLAGNVGTWDWNKSIRHFQRRAIALGRRGNVGFQGDISNVGQVP
jgi:hypothetical protein